MIKKAKSQEKMGGCEGGKSEDSAKNVENKKKKQKKGGRIETLQRQL